MLDIIMQLDILGYTSSNNNHLSSHEKVLLKKKIWETRPKPLLKQYIDRL